MVYVFIPENQQKTTLIQDQDEYVQRIWTASGFLLTVDHLVRRFDHQVIIQI